MRTCLFRPKEDKNLLTTSDKPAARTARTPRPRSSSVPKPKPVVVAPPAPPVAPPAPEVTRNGFAELRLSDEVNRAIREMGYVQPTEIQAQVIPLLLDTRDVIGQAQTGTGKTAAFGLPLIEGIDETLAYPQALVLAPTRELAMQIGVELRRIAQYLPGITVATIYGGASYGRQFDDLKAGAQVV